MPLPDFGGAAPGSPKLQERQGVGDDLVETSTSGRPLALDLTSETCFHAPRVLQDTEQAVLGPEQVD